MKKLKEIYNFIKEKYQNPRTRAAVILSIYLIFFVFLFVALKTPSSTTSNNNEKIENYKNISSNYKYNYNIEIRKKDDTHKYLITGTNNNGNVNEKLELYNNELNIYEEIYDFDDINSKFIDLKNIISYVNNIKEEFTTNYKDGTIQKNYLVELNKIDADIDSKETIEINVYEKNSFITKIIIDGTNFDSKTNKEITYSKYNLEYNKITSEE